MRESRSGDPEIVRSDQTSRPIQIGPKPRVHTSDRHIELENRKRREHCLHEGRTGQLASGGISAVNPMEQLAGSDDGKVGQVEPSPYELSPQQ